MSFPVEETIFGLLIGLLQSLAGYAIDTLSAATYNPNKTFVLMRGDRYE